ncbi:MAG: hypothetical protein HHAS10_10970 [Candidatus Altimarinota bacterium]
MKKIILLMFIGFLSIISQEVFLTDGLDDETSEIQVYKSRIESFQFEL